MTLALILGFGATAQNTNDWFDWETDTEDTYFDASSIEMFNWNAFSDLFDLTTSIEGIGEWASINELIEGLRGSTTTPILPSGHGGDGDVDAPLGSGIAVLVGLGAAYAMAKRRKEE